MQNKPFYNPPKSTNIPNGCSCGCLIILIIIIIILF